MALQALGTTPSQKDIDDQLQATGTSIAYPAFKAAYEKLREQELRQRPRGGEMPVKLRLEADDSPDLPVSFLGKGLGCRGQAKEELLNEYKNITI